MNVNQVSKGLLYHSNHLHLEPPFHRNSCEIKISIIFIAHYSFDKNHELAEAIVPYGFVGAGLTATIQQHMMSCVHGCVRFKSNWINTQNNKREKKSVVSAIFHTISIYIQKGFYPNTFLRRCLECKKKKIQLMVKIWHSPI